MSHYEPSRICSGRTAGEGTMGRVGIIVIHFMGDAVAHHNRYPRPCPLLISCLIRKRMELLMRLAGIGSDWLT